MYVIDLLSYTNEAMETTNSTYKNQHSKKPYTTFIGMLVASFIAMYVCMYFNTYEMNHVYFSLTRCYMTCIGIAAMSAIMLLCMRHMYQNKKKNTAILSGSLLLFIAAIILVRTQTPVGDVLYMKAMIPHHSIALLTSRNAEIEDPEVRALADQIILAQEKEIAVMKTLIDKLEKEK